MLGPICLPSTMVLKKQLKFDCFWVGGVFPSAHVFMNASSLQSSVSQQHILLEEVALILTSIPQELSGKTFGTQLLLIVETPEWISIETMHFSLLSPNSFSF